MKTHTRMPPRRCGWVVVLLGLAWMVVAEAAGPSTTPDPYRQAAWNTAQAQAAARVDAFDAAMRSGNPESIRKAALDLQSDPIAVQKLNSGNEALINAHNDVTKEIKTQAKKNIQNEMAKKWNADNPGDPISPDEVKIDEPSNFKKPGAKPRVGQDWDVTVSVKGQDVPPTNSKSAVEKGYFEAAGGKKTFGADATPESVARQQSIETTHGKSTEAYNEPKKILGTKEAPPNPGEKLAEPDQLTRAVENKSHKAANEAAEYRTKAAEAWKAGNEAAAHQYEVEAVKKDFEQLRQAHKQYDATTKPRVEAAGGKVSDHVDKGMDIIKNSASPEEARIKLAEMGETPESIINKAAGQAEATQKLKSPSADGPDGKPRVTADGPDGGLKTKVDGPNGAPRTTVDGPDGKPRVTVDGPDGQAGAGGTKAGKALEVLGKGMVAVDVLSGAQDAKEAIKEGDMKKLGEAGINVVDGFTGGAIGTTRTMVDRGGRAIETAEIGIEAQKKENEAADQRIILDLRKAKYSPEEIKAIMEAKGKGDEGPLGGAYEKLGKEIPRPTTVDFTLKELAEIYVAEVRENSKEVGVGMKDKVVKAGTFVKEAGQDLHEIGSGLTEKGTRDEVIDQVKENVSVDNLTGAWETWKTNKQAVADSTKMVQDLADKLVSKGIDPAEAKKAAETFGKGDRSMLDAQVKQIKDARDDKEKKNNGKEKNTPPTTQSKEGTNKKKTSKTKDGQQQPTSQQAPTTPPQNAGQTIEKGWVENKSGRTTLSHTYDSRGNLISVTETDTDPSGKVTGVRTYPGQGGSATVSGGSGSTAGGGGYNPLNDPALQGKGQGGGSGQVSTNSGDFQKGQWSALDQQSKTSSLAGSPYVTDQSPGYTTPYGGAPPTTPTSDSKQQGSAPDPGTQGTSSGGLSDVVVSSHTITVSVWDHGTVDGDIINITLNGASVAGGVTLAKAPKTFTLKLNPGSNTISIYAVNQGKVGPNTASIKISHVTSGKAEQTYSINQKTSASFGATVDAGMPRQR